jgi:RIO-like serine/threonine protein kinase
MLGALVRPHLTIATRQAGSCRVFNARRITGRIANRDSTETKLVRGEPPTSIDKLFSVDTMADAEFDALSELLSLGFDRLPELIGRPRRRLLQIGWTTGEPLHPHRLARSELLRWTARATRVLDEIQDLTRRDDGSVLAHGDFWLGNLMVEGDDVTAVPDWTDARRDVPSVDRSFLASTTAMIAGDAPGTRALIDRIVDGR